MQTLTKAVATLDLVLFMGILALLLCLFGATLNVWMIRRLKVPVTHWSFIALSGTGGMVISWILVGVFRLAVYLIW